MENPGNKSLAVLIVSIVIAFGAWGTNASLESWSQVFEVQNALSLIGAVGAVILSWLSKSPLKPK